MKQEWQEPRMEILTFEAEDVVTESGVIGPDPGDQGTPWI